MRTPSFSRRSLGGGSTTLGFDFLPTIIPLTEHDRRRAEFAGGTPIVLPDGQPWRFFDPMPVKRSIRGENGEEGFVLAWEFGPGVDAETNDSLGQGFARVLEKIDAASNKADRTCGVIEAMWYLLARNYVISQDDFEDLLLRGSTHTAERRRRLYDRLRDLVMVPCEQLRRLISNQELA